MDSLPVPLAERPDSSVYAPTPCDSVAQPQHVSLQPAVCNHGDHESPQRMSLHHEPTRPVRRALQLTNDCTVDIQGTSPSSADECILELCFEPGSFQHLLQLRQVSQPGLCPLVPQHQRLDMQQHVGLLAITMGAWCC